jgi:hypothetical protein
MSRCHESELQLADALTRPSSQSELRGPAADPAQSQRKTAP